MSSILTCMPFTFKLHPITPQTRRLRCSATSESNGNIATLPDRRLSRRDFPLDFKFGAASSAYQIEGAYKADGKGKSIWDEFTSKFPNKIEDGRNGDEANRSYEFFMMEEDIKILKELGVDSYRFSISWSRIFPEGTGRTPNKHGLNYYKRLIRALKNNDITPCVTLFHWDLPQHLAHQYEGCLDKRFKSDFLKYATTCFEHFGDDVKHWVTFNEPHIFCTYGYELGKHAPGRSGDPSKEPYIVAHNVILAHAEVVNLYKSKYKNSQNGEIGITLDCDWTEAYSDSYRDCDAAERTIDFKLGWFMDPLVYGDYPFIMRALVRDRLPTFKEDEVKLVQDSFDFIGLNYYQARYGRATQIKKDDKPVSYTKDQYTDILEKNKDDQPIGYMTSCGQYIYPEGMKKLLLHMKRKYNNPVMYITENGVGNKEMDDKNDVMRINYMQSHLEKVSEAIRDEKANVKGYYVWSLMDSFEWGFGYTHNYGLYSVDRDYDFKRIQKLSGHWYYNFLNPREEREPLETQLSSPGNGVIQTLPAHVPTLTHTTSAPVEAELL